MNKLKKKLNIFSSSFPFDVKCKRVQMMKDKWREEYNPLVIQFQIAELLFRSSKWEYIHLNSIQSINYNLVNLYIWRLYIFLSVPKYLCFLYMDITKRFLLIIYICFVSPIIPPPSPLFTLPLVCGPYKDIGLDHYIFIHFSARTTLRYIY